MYFTRGDSGMQTMPHTQSAVNNFLGMHRFDASLWLAFSDATALRRRPCRFLQKHADTRPQTRARTHATKNSCAWRQ